MQKKILAFIKRYHLFDPGDCVVAAVSGGADSVCLLHVLWGIKERRGLELRAVHVHHGLRGEEADRDAAYVESLAKAWGIPCTVVYVKAGDYAREHKLTVEEAGRELRYRALREAAKDWERERKGEEGQIKIAVAHQQDDQAETILHNLFRGSGLCGLGGMPPVREDIVRPLLCVTREEILKYLEENGLSCCEDSTNDSTKYTRNKLRRILIPEICGMVNKRAVEHIIAAGEKAAQADAYFSREAGRLWRENGIRRGREDSDISGAGFTLSFFLSQPEILRGYLVMELISQQSGSLKDIASSHITQICALADKQTGSCIHLPYGLRAVREYEMLWIEKTEAAKSAKTSQMAGQDVCISQDSLQMSIFSYEKGTEIPQKRYTKWFDYDKIKGTLSVRTRTTGDFLMLKGGKRKTVKAFMIDEKIPRKERQKVMLLAEENHVLWIVGYRISEYYKVTEATKRVLQVQMNGGGEYEG